jgi:hypothetical protein
MTLKEAYKILGASSRDDDREIKTKYKKLLIMYHPDSDPNGNRNPEDDDKIRLVIEAYKKIRESAGETVTDSYEFTWDAFENRTAFSERNIYVQFRIFDEDLPLSRMARGRFVWDPDMEDFPLFTKSVLEACKEVMTVNMSMPDADKIKDIFNYMMQEYVLPADAARKLGNKISDDGKLETYSFSGYLKEDISQGIRISEKNIGEPLNIFLREDRAVVEEIVTGKIIGNVSFDEDELYYVVLPLLEDPEVDASATITRSDINNYSGSGRIRSRAGNKRLQVIIKLNIPKGLKDTPVSNRKLIIKLLK